MRRKLCYIRFMETIPADSTARGEAGEALTRCAWAVTDPLYAPTTTRSGGYRSTTTACSSSSWFWRVLRPV